MEDLDTVIVAGRIRLAEGLYTVGMLDDTDRFFRLQDAHAPYSGVALEGGQRILQPGAVLLGAVDQVAQPVAQIGIAHALDLCGLQAAHRFAGHQIIALAVDFLVDQAIGGFLEQLAGRHADIGLGARRQAMIALVADDNPAQTVFQFSPITLEGDRETVLWIEMVRVQRFGLARRARYPVQQAAIGAGQHKTVNGMMAMVLAVFRLVGLGEIMVGQKIVQPPFRPQHGCHPSRRHIDLLADPFEIFARHARHVLGVDQMARLKAALLFETRHGVGLETPGLARKQALGPLDDVLQRIARPRLARRPVTLETVAVAHAQHLVGKTVVQRLGVRQDMVDIDRGGKQHRLADRRPAVDAHPLVRRQFGIEFEQEPAGKCVGEIVRRQFGADCVILLFVLAILALDLVLALLVQLQFAGQFHDDGGRHAIGVDQRIDHGPQLVQPDMHRRIGHPPDRILTAIRGGLFRDHMPGQHLAIIGQTPVRRPVGQARMVQVQQPDRLVIGQGRRQHLAGFRIDGVLAALHRRNQIGQHAAAELAMALRQADRRDEIRCLAVQTAGLAQPGLQFGRILDGQQALDDLDLARPRKTAPQLAERFLVAQLHRRLVGRKPLAAGQFIIEAGVFGQFRRLAQLVETDRIAASVHQRRAYGAVFGQGQLALALARARHTQLAGVLQDAETLEQGMRLGRALAAIDVKAQAGIDVLAGAQRAAAHRRRFQRALLDDDALQLCEQRVRQDAGMEGRLSCPDRVQLALDQVAIGVERIGQRIAVHLRPETDRAGRVHQAVAVTVALVPAGQVFAQRAGIFRFQGRL